MPAFSARLLAKLSCFIVGGTLLSISSMNAEHSAALVETASGSAVSVCIAKV